MSETPEQYTQRILGHVGGKDPLAVQRDTPGKLAKLVRGLKPAQLRRPPAPGKWSIAEIAAHLAEAELVVGFRLRMMLNKPGVTIQAFDQNVWAATSNYAKQDVKQSLAMFRALREANLRLLRAQPSENLERWGMHEERGKETVAHTVRMIAGHDLNHLGQIEAIRAQFRR